MRHETQYDTRTSSRDNYLMNHPRTEAVDTPFPKGAALVTGGSGGIGQAVCLRLAQAGSDIAVGYHSNRAAAEDVAAKVQSFGRNATIIQVQTGDEGRAKAAVNTIAEDAGGLHTLVYASGPDLPMRHISRTPPSEFRDYMLQDAVGFYNLVFPALPHLRASRGSIVALTTAGLERYPARDILSVAPKAAVEAVIRGIAKEEGRFGVRANAVGIAAVEAGMHWRLRESGHYTEETLEITRRNRSLMYNGKPEDVAEAVLYLASRMSAPYVTGQTIHTCGGYAI